MMTLNEKIQTLAKKVTDLQTKVAEGPGKPGPAKKPEPSAYDVRREDSVESTYDFGRDAFDAIMAALDSISIFKTRLENLSGQEALRINPEGVKSLMGLANSLEASLNAIYDKAEPFILAIEEDRL
jgi:hypothetical protein